MLLIKEALFWRPQEYLISYGLLSLVFLFCLFWSWVVHSQDMNSISLSVSVFKLPLRSSMVLSGSREEQDQKHGTILKQWLLMWLVSSGSGLLQKEALRHRFRPGSSIQKLCRKQKSGRRV